MRKETNYPSIDKTHLKNTKFFERHPLIPSLTFSQVLDLMFALQGNHQIVDCLDLRIDSKQFQKDSLLIAKALLELGVKPNDIITVSMPNYYQAIPVFKAANMIGATTTYLNPLASFEETKNYLNLYESPIFINCGKNEEYNNEIRKNTSVKHVITMKEELINSIDFYQKDNYTIGNKDDLKEGRTVNDDDIKKFSERTGIEVVEASAKNAHMVNFAFEKLTNKLITVREKKEVHINLWYNSFNDKTKPGRNI